MTFAGFPAAKQPAGISFVTTDPAPIIAPSPIVTPFNIVTPTPIQTFFPIYTGCVGIWLEFKIVCVSLSLICTFSDIIVPSPITILSLHLIFEFYFIYPFPKIKIAPSFIAIELPAYTEKHPFTSKVASLHIISSPAK